MNPPQNSQQYQSYQSQGSFQCSVDNRPGGYYYGTAVEQPQVSRGPVGVNLHSANTSVFMFANPGTYALTINFNNGNGYSFGSYGMTPSNSSGTSSNGYGTPMSSTTCSSPFCSPQSSNGSWHCSCVCSTPLLSPISRVNANGTLNETRRGSCGFM